ncbi:MAG: AMP-binding protein [Breznakibacter sp.]
MENNGYIDLMSNAIVNNQNLNAFSDYLGDVYTYKQVGDQISRLHELYHRIGISKGDRIAIVGRNMSAWAISYLSVVSYGAVVVPILHDFSANDIQHIVNHSGALFLFATDLQFDKFDHDKMPHIKGILSLPDFNVLCENHKGLKSTWEAINQAPTGELKLAGVGAEEMMVLSYTSGTSGFSKGVMLPHRSIWSNVQFARDSFDIKAGDRMVSFLPLAHAYGCLFEFLWPFTVGVHITFISKTPSPRIIIEAFQAVKPHLILSVPLILEKIFKKNIHPIVEKGTVAAILRIPLVNKLVHAKIRHKLVGTFGGEFREMIVGGAALNHDVEEFLHKIGFPLTVGYGMTECGPLISYAPALTTKLRSAGKVVHRMHVRIDHPDPVTKVGEICVKGDNLMLGYYKNPDATREIFDEDGWLHTGDLGIADGDDFIFIKGRSKSMILGASGQNIYPEEIEALLNSMDLVQESLVRDMGDGRLEALIYPDFEMADSLGLSEQQLENKLQEIKSEANKILPAYQNLSKVTLFPEEFEKTPKRSIKRFVYNV